MDKESYKRYLRSPWWREKKNRIYKLRNGQCEICGKKYDLNVHHTPEAYKHLGKEPDNLLRLWCHSCHDHHHEYHFGKKKPAQRRVGLVMRVIEVYKVIMKTKTREKKVMDFSITSVEQWYDLVGYAIRHKKKYHPEELSAWHELQDLAYNARKAIDQGEKIIIRK